MIVVLLYGIRVYVSFYFRRCAYISDVCGYGWGVSLVYCNCHPGGRWVG